MPAKIQADLQATADSTDGTGAGNVAALAGRLEDHATELNRSFNILLEGLQTSLQEASEACLANVLVYEQAAEANKVKRVDWQITYI